MLLLCFGLMAMVTPPAAVGDYATATIAGANFWKTGWESTRMSLAAYIVPFVFVFAPALILEGAPLEIEVVTLRTLVGLFIVTVASAGFLFGNLSTPMRFLLAVVGILTIVPVSPGISGEARVLNVIGLAAGVVLLVMHRLQARRIGQAVAGA